MKIRMMSERARTEARGLRGVMRIACAVLCAAADPVWAQGGPPPANVVLDAVRVEPIAQQRDVTGQVRSRLRSTLAGQESGIVVVFGLEQGDRVRAGQIVAELDAELLRTRRAEVAASVAVAEARVGERGAELALREREWARIEELRRTGNASVGEIDTAQSQLDIARATLRAAEAEVLQAKANEKITAERLDDMKIVAPFDGVVVRTHTEVGQWLGAGDSVVTVVATDRLEAVIDVPEAMVGLLTSDATVPVEVRGLGAWVEGRLIAVVPQADELSRLFPVRLEVPSTLADGRGIRPGMSVTASVPTTDVLPTMLVSKDAILRNDAGEFVYFDAGGVGAVGPIQRLFAVGDRVAVRSPVLRAGMRVVVQGNERMFPGQPLMVLNAEEYPPVGGGTGGGGSGGPGAGGGAGEGRGEQDTAGRGRPGGEG